MSYWTNKAAVITGGSAGLGWAIAEQLVRQDANIVLVARNESRLQEACERLAARPRQVAYVAADIRHDADVERVVDGALSRHQQLHALFNVAGMSDRGLASATPLERYRELWELNFLASVRCVQHFLPHLLRTQGHVINIGSLAAKVAPRYLGAYPASKFPLGALSQQLRLEHSAEGLHVLFVCPGPIARPDAASRHAARAADLPAAAQGPAGGAKVRALPPAFVAQQILDACQQRQIELILPQRARWLFALSQLWPAWGDRLLRGHSG